MNNLKLNDLNEQKRLCAPSDGDDSAIEIVDKPCTFADRLAFSINKQREATNQSNIPSNRSMYNRIFHNDQGRPTSTIVIMLRVVFLIMIVFLTVTVIYVIVPAFEGNGDHVAAPSIDEQRPNDFMLIVPASIQNNEHLIRLLDSIHTNCVSCSNLPITIVVNALDFSSLQDSLADYVDKFPSLDVMAFNTSTSSELNQSMTASMAACLLSTSRYCWFAPSASALVQSIELSSLTNVLTNQAISIQSFDQSVQQLIVTSPSDSASSCSQNNFRESLSWFNGTSIAVVDRVAVHADVIQALNLAISLSSDELAQNKAFLNADTACVV